MKVCTAAAIREIERVAIEERGIPSLTLMERAASAVRDAVKQSGRKRIVLLCGQGKNGGDGFAAAKMLADAGLSVTVYSLGDPSRRAPETAHYAALYAGEVRTAPDDGILRAEVIVDALFGVGFHGALEGDFRAAVELANRRRGPGSPLRIAVDVPSGVNADTGEVQGEAFDAALTVTFTLPKAGLYLLPGALYAGRVVTASVGIPLELLAGVRAPFGTIDRMMADAVMPVRRPDAHKGNFGRLLVVGGCADYPGAVAFAANAAVRTGAGLVTAAVPAGLYPIVAPKFAEAMPRRMPEDAAGRFSPDALPGLLTLQDASQAVVLGPGLGRSDALTALVPALLAPGKCPVVVDADGIFALAAHMDVLQTLSRAVILTPHDGEFARLARVTPPSGGMERVACAREFAVSRRCLLVLKGHRTIVASPDGHVYVNTTGNPGMARGGSGDVLAGMIGALLAQGLSPVHAAVLGVYFHGAAGDLCANTIGEYGMTPTDMIARIPAVLKRYNGRVW
ncbi:MAG: NAD(P)H-hydrate dehydratase [Clostridiales bacterium]|nr:NAD(P)H-hydrate dehydratase [Clostridiales bacterium]